TEARCRLVEADVTVAADAKDLQINSAGVLDRLLVRVAVAVVVPFDCAVRNMNVLLRNIDAREEMLAHEKAKALRMCPRKAEIFVEVKGDDTGEVERLLAVQARQFLVHADCRTAGSQAQTRIGISANRVSNDT